MTQQENLKPAQGIDHHEDDLVEGRCDPMCLAHRHFVTCGCPDGAAEESSKEDENAKWN